MDEPQVEQAAPIRTILVPLDGSQLAERALPVAISLAGSLGATITLFHVLESDPPKAVHGEPHLMHQEEAITYLSAIQSRFAGSGVGIESHVHPNPEQDVSRSIVEHVDELEVDLVVLANHGTGGVRGFFFGRVAQQVVQRGKKPVLAIPTTGDHFGSAPLRRLALLVNQTPESESAIPIAARLAADLHATLHLILAVPTTGTLASERSAAATLLPSAARELLTLEAQAAQAYLDAISAQLQSNGITVTSSVVRGEPAKVSIEEAARVEAQLLIFTTHARGGLSGVLSGSVGSKILAKAHLPLMLVPAG